MHRKTKRLVSALLAAALCTAAALPAGAEPWTYEVDDVMGTYGVEYYADVGFENPTRTQDTAAQGTTGISTYGTDAAQYAAVDSGLGYTTTQLPGGITLYSPTDTGISTYAMDTDFAVESDVATYATNATKVEKKESVDSVNYSVYSVTIPADVTFDDENKVHTMTVTGTVYNYSSLSVAVKAGHATEATGVDTTINSSLECGSYKIPYTLTLGQTQQGVSSSNLNGATLEPVQWSDTIQATTSAVYFRKGLTVTMEDTSNAVVSGDYKDILTFTMEGHRAKYAITYSNVNGGGGTYQKEYPCGASVGVLPSASDAGFTAPNDGEDYEFLGWATWQDSDSASTTTAKNVYAPGLPIVTLTKMEGGTLYDDVYAKDNGTMMLYAQWAKKLTAATSCKATLHYENNYYRRPETGVAGSGVNLHDYKNITDGATVLLTGVELQAGQTYYWTLSELQTYLGTNKLPEDDEYYDPDAAAKVVVGQVQDDVATADIYIGRKWICVDVNCDAKFLDGGNVSVGSLKITHTRTYNNKTETVTEVVGTVKVTYDGAETTGKDVSDYWMLHTYGSTITVEIIAASNYTVDGYRVQGADDSCYTVENPSSGTAGNTFTITFSPMKEKKDPKSTTPLSRQISIWPHLTQLAWDATTSTADLTGDAVTLLPSWDETTPVVTDWSTLQPDTTQTETTQDAADAQTTPDDMLIWDASTQPMYDESFSVWDDDVATLPALGDGFAVAW